MEDMKIDIQTCRGMDRPMYILEENRLRNNLKTIQRVAREAGVEVILAFKAYARRPTPTMKSTR